MQQLQVQGEYSQACSTTLSHSGQFPVPRRVVWILITYAEAHDPFPTTHTPLLPSNPALHRYFLVIAALRLVSAASVAAATLRDDCGAAASLARSPPQTCATSWRWKCSRFMLLLQPLTTFLRRRLRRRCVIVNGGGAGT
jgi:hypothetical protein